MSLLKDCPGSKIIKQPVPLELECKCGKLVEIWSDEMSVVCKNCRREVKKEIPPSCLDWCSMAKFCIGEGKLRKYLQSKNKEN